MVIYIYKTTNNKQQAKGDQNYVDKQLAKEAAILLYERSELNVIKVGRWRKDGQILKREFTCRHCKGHEFIVEITFDKTANHVYCKVFFNDTDLQDRASKCLADMFLGSIFVYNPITNWTNQKNCMVSYLSIYDANKKYNGKAVLTADGVINIYANDKLIMSRNCLKEVN